MSRELSVSRTQLSQYHFLFCAPEAVILVEKWRKQIVVSADFSKNYAFVLQDAAQGVHRNNAQATIHAFAVYYKESGEEHHLSFVVISDHLIHD